jgi:hypothetical protein
LDDKAVVVTWLEDSATAPIDHPGVAQRTAATAVAITTAMGISHVRTQTSAN